MLYSGTDPESYITEYTLVYEDKRLGLTKLLSRFSKMVSSFTTVVEDAGFAVQIRQLSRFKSVSFGPGKGSRRFTKVVSRCLDRRPKPIGSAREFFIDNILVRIHFIIVMTGWTGLAPWDFEFPFPGSLTSTFLTGARARVLRHGGHTRGAGLP